MLSRMPMHCDKHGYQGSKKLNLRLCRRRVAMSQAANGLRSADTQREERWKEGTQGLNLLQSQSATDGGSGGEEGTQLLVHLENASRKRDILLQANTAEEVMAGIFREVPNLQCPQLWIELFLTPYGSQGRKPLIGVLPKVKELYATLYLRKH